MEAAVVREGVLPTAMETFDVLLDNEVDVNSGPHTEEGSRL